MLALTTRHQDWTELHHVLAGLICTLLVGGIFGLSQDLSPGSSYRDVDPASEAAVSWAQFPL
jgi:hypothetical protein